jgi:hypothetical protein
MKKYNEEYFSVIEISTGRKIADCGEELDALSLVSFNPQNRTYVRNKFLMGQVVDIEIQKTLPTNNISISNTQEKGCSIRKQQLLNLGIIGLPEGQGKPIKV